MVEDRITDGRRIAQLLASELSERDEDRLGSVEVIAADPDAEPTEHGTTAYRIAVQGESLAAVVIYPDAAELVFEPAAEARTAATARAIFDQEAARERACEEGLATALDRDAVRIDSGAAVKRALDAFRAGL
jgi:hypothetical protein